LPTEGGYALANEAAFLELAPDRGSAFIAGALEKAAAKGREHGAILLLAAFSGMPGWRSLAPAGLHSCARRASSQSGMSQAHCALVKPMRRLSMSRA
jgi:hypothetical protein